MEKSYRLQFYSHLGFVVYLYRTLKVLTYHCPRIYNQRKMSIFAMCFPHYKDGHMRSTYIGHVQRLFGRSEGREKCFDYIYRPHVCIHHEKRQRQLARLSASRYTAVISIMRPLASSSHRGISTCEQQLPRTDEGGRRDGRGGGYKRGKDTWVGGGERERGPEGDGWSLLFFILTREGIASLPPLPRELISSL